MSDAAIATAPLRLTFSGLKHNIGNSTIRLHWLCVPERMQFRSCFLAYHCVHSTALVYLSDSLRPTSEIVARRCLCSADTTTLQVPSTRPAPLATAPFRWLQRGHGTVCHQRLGPASHFWHSEGRPSLTFFVSHTADLALSIQTISRRLRWAVQQF